ncbi:MAG TPA: hypothetical protein VMR74_06530 [Gammaproteobacteria bacterium]|nr:hypothetical protein [Gammaproteobacteria bacterium]
MKPPRTVKEALLALAALAVGLIGLPAMVYLVGQLLVGEYEAGLPGFYQAIGAALTDGRWHAWMLVLSPYIGIQLLRFVYWLRRNRRAVS